MVHSRLKDFTEIYNPNIYKMKLSRLLAYGAAGIIAGLLIENKALIFKQNAGSTARKAKKKATKIMHKVV